ncbi:flagellar assembly protein FliW [Cerasibacillus sp. JNUCC 74]
MLLATKYFGEIDVTPTNMIHFPTGILGFPQETEFVLLDFPDNPLFQILQSIKRKEIAFIVVNPYQLYEDYTFKLDDGIVKALQLSDETEIVVLSIVTLKQPFDTSTMNLQAPIIINANKQQGKQFVINSDKYSTRVSITALNSPSGKGE